jgi:hypothetical protein
MDTVFCSQMSARGNDCFSGRQGSDLAHNLAALGENCGPSGAMNCTIDSTTAEQR